MSKVLVIPVMPDARRRKQQTRKGDTRYIEGQRLIVEAMKYLAQSGPQQNKPAFELLSEHFRTQFRSTDSPLQ
jgi:hypothetical protein